MKWLAAILLTCSIVTAQDSRPKFEVASVKECKSGERSTRSTNSPGTLHLSCWNLKRLILQAYEAYADGKVNPLNPLNPLMPLAPIDGDPNWVASTAYTIDAKAEGPVPAAMMMGPIMQTLLEERFHLKVHHETRDVPAYLMTVAPGGAKLQPSKEGSCVHLDPTDFAQPPLAPGLSPCVVPKQTRQGQMTIIDIRGITLGVFAKLLHPDNRPVVDRTGIEGAFDIHLEFEASASNPPSNGAAADPSPHASDIQATREQLGLRLEPGKGPVEFLVIDHIERPSEN